MSEPAAKSTPNTPKRPYPPSWMDRLTAWIDALRIPAWAAYLLVFFAIAIAVNVVFWIEGIAPFASFDLIESLLSLLIIYWVALYQYLTRVGTRALLAFRPLLDVSDSEFNQLDYELATLPRSLGRLSVFLGLLLQVVSIPFDPRLNAILSAGNILLYSVEIITTTFLGITFFCVVIRSIRQLRMVGRLHLRAANINILDLSPAHAFAALTSRTGMGVILIMIVGYLYESSFDLETTAVDIFLYLSIATLAIVIFVAPLAGMRARLEDAKDRALSKVNTLLRVATERLHRKISDDDHKNMRQATAAISSLIAERDLLHKTSTWPWDTRTLRGFASTLLLPIFLLLVSQLIERIF